MKTRLFDTTALTEFTPRSMCFAEADASDAGAGGNVPGPTGDDAPDIEIEEPDNANDNNDDEPDDLEEVEFEGRKHRIPKAWKDPLEQGKDYRYKTGVTAAEKRAAEAERTKYSGLVQEYERSLKATQPAKPSPNMLDRTSAEYDPDQYHLMRANWEGWAQKMFNTEQERKRLEGEDNAKAERERGERKSTTERELVKAFPHWKDPSVRAAERVKLEEYARQTGVSDDEMSELDHDHRLTSWGYKAMLYDQAVAKARTKKGDEPHGEPITPMPVRKTSGGGGGRGTNAPPKDTAGYIAWRKRGGKM